MKKYLLYALFAVGLLSSCNMDEAPYGALDDDNAIQSANDAQRYRNGFYSGFRSMTSGSYITKPELQADMFNGITINGNRNGTIANGNLLAGDGDVLSLWSTCYGRIASVNYFLSKAEPLLENTEDADDRLDIERYIGEAHFTRAFYYIALFDRFCQVYSSDKGETPALGVPITLEYNPTADRSKYPGRSTMNESVKLINDELKLALTAMQTYEASDKKHVAPMSPYICSYTVMALQARFALMIGDYPTAISKAESVINSKVYTLANTDNYIDMWVDDESSEIIFRPFASSSEQPNLNATGTAWISIYDDRADYIPGFEALAMYEDGDVRFDAFFNIRGLTVDGAEYPCYNFNKFPGNPALKTSTANNLMNMPKPFRLSEQYLILAEAAAMNNQPDKANAALNTLRANRIIDWEDANYSGQVLIQQVRDERTKELIGEGFRITDLRRWKQGFKRSYDYPAAWGLDAILVTAGLSVQYSADDHRYTWPIPSDEIQVNPQLKGQQNPGY